MIFHHQKLKVGAVQGTEKCSGCPPSLHRGDHSMTTRPHWFCLLRAGRVDVPSFLSQLAVFQRGHPAGLVCSPAFKAEAKVIIACYLCGTWRATPAYAAADRHFN